jgi:hypothetical protein
MKMYFFYSSKVQESDLYTYGYKALTESWETLQPQLHINHLNLHET